MNERIREIADMAQICANNLMASNSTEEQIQERFNQVFAELIVRECEALCYATARGQDAEAIAEAILEHFGVEP